jgi:hypothetical protein
MNQSVYSPEVEAQRKHYERLAEIMIQKIKTILILSDDIS